MVLADRGLRGPLRTVTDRQFVALCNGATWQQLSERAGLSRTMIRNRLRRLEADGHLYKIIGPKEDCYQLGRPPVFWYRVPGANQ